MSRRALQVLAAASIGSVLLAGTAAAQTTQITWASNVFGDGSEAMTLNIAKAFNNSNYNFVDSNQSFGGLSGTFTPVPIGDPVTGATNLLWCTDIPQQFTPGNSYTYNILPLTTANNGAEYLVNPPTTASATQITTILYNAEANSGFANELGKLTPGSATQSIWSAAVQLAIWAVLYDSSTAGYNLTGGTPGNFTVSGLSGDDFTAVSNAQAMINCVVLGSGCSSLSGWAGSAPTGYGAYQFIDAGVQSVGGLMFTNGGQGQGVGVPEPPSIALLAAGLLALPMLRRRRSDTAARKA